MDTVLKARLQIEGKIDAVVTSSRLYRSEAFPPGSGPDFVNGGFALTTPLEADVILEILHQIERDAGRERGLRWGPRPLDLDLIACGADILPDAATWRHWATLDSAAQRTAVPEGLILPHPRLQDRAFVLKPLADLAPDWRHPVLGQTIADMLAALPEADRDGVVPLM